MKTSKTFDTKQKTVRLVMLALFSALIILLTCLPLKTLGLEIIFTVIPIAVGAVLLGPSGGAILGTVYGICSFLQCLGLLLPSAFGAALLGINPFLTAVVCIVPRFLCGFLSGLIFKALSKIDKTKFISHAVACLACPVLNTLFFMSSLMIFFGGSELIQGFMQTLGVFNPFLFVIAFVGINGAVEAGSCFVIATSISKILTVMQKKIK